MTPLRQRMIEDMQVRNLALNTQRSYLEQVSRFSRHFNKSPEQLGPADIRAYQVYLTKERKLAPSSITTIRSSFLKLTRRLSSNWATFKQRQRQRRQHPHERRLLHINGVDMSQRHLTFVESYIASSGWI